MTTTKNPWLVDDISEFLSYCCPECTFRTNKNEAFENHATATHPLSLAFFKMEPNIAIKIEPETELIEEPVAIKIEPKTEPIEETSETINIIESEAHEDETEMEDTDPLNIVPSSGPVKVLIESHQSNFIQLTASSIGPSKPKKPKIMISRPAVQDVQDSSTDDACLLKCQKCSKKVDWMTLEDCLGEELVLCQHCTVPPDPLQCRDSKSCASCGEKFQYYPAYFAHRKEHKNIRQTKVFDCKHCCTFASNSKEEMDSHFDDHMKKMHCFLCDEVVTVFKMQQHYQDVHANNDTNLKCCSKTFASTYQLFKHLNNCSRSVLKNKNDGKTYHCSTCRKKFKDRRLDCLNHFLSRFQCNKCQKCFNERNVWVDHKH